MVGNCSYIVKGLLNIKVPNIQRMCYNFEQYINNFIFNDKNKIITKYTQNIYVFR